MKKTPRASGLVLCSRLGIHPPTREPALIGLFQSLDFSVWPSPICAFAVFSVLQHGEGEGIMQLRITQLDTERDVYRKTKWFAWPTGMAVFHFNLEITKCIFPAPGRHLVTLWFDEVQVSERLLFVEQTRETP